MAKFVWSAMSMNLNDIVPSGPLFKFLSLAENQEPTWRQRLCQLLAGEAYFPSPSQFNDPFDCLPKVIVPTTIEELRAKKHLLVAKFLEHAPNHDEKSIDATFDKLLEIADISEIVALFQKSVHRTSHTMGVFSLAENINHVLMWSHYASNHTGIAVKFDWRRQQHGGLMPLFKVRYEVRRPSILNFLDDRFIEYADDIADALCTKAEFWSYEQEWRSIAPGMARQVVNFDPAVIDGIVLGANCSEENEEWIRAKMRGLRLPIMRAFPDSSTYDMHFAILREDLAS